MSIEKESKIYTFSAQPRKVGGSLYILIPKLFGVNETNIYEFTVKVPEDGKK